MKFNPLTKLVVIILATFVFLANVSVHYEIVFVLFLGLLILLNGDALIASVFIAIFFLLLLISVTVFSTIHSTWSIIGSFLIIGGRRFLPTVMATVFALRHTYISEWMRLFQKAHVPLGIILPLVVVFRFFPTLLNDLGNILKQLQLRGLIRSKLALVVHPVLGIEFVLIPILTSADRIVTDLSSVAITRGIAIEGKHTSIYGGNLHWNDYVVLTAAILLVFGRWFIA